MNELRLLPASPEAEKGLLCSFLLAPREVGAFCAERHVTSNSFHVNAHGLLYETLAEKWEAGKPIDILTLTQTLFDRNQLEKCGGPGYVSEISTHVGTPSNATAYLDTVREKKTLREIIEFADEIRERAYLEQDDLAGLLASLTGTASRLCDPKHDRARTMLELVTNKMERIVAGRSDEGQLKTGIAKLDSYSPIRRGSMPLVCGERKSGKSILALSIAAEIAGNGHRVLYFSLEDPAEEAIDRLTANISRVPIVKHRDGHMSQVEQDNVCRGLDVIARLPLVIRDDVYDLSGLSAVVRQEKARHPDLSLVVVDYAQLVRALTRKQDTREMEVAKTSRTLRLLSIELGIAIMPLSQLNQDGATRESKALEQDCTALWRVALTDDPKVRLLEIPFQRNGESQVKFRVTFLGHLSRFENFAGPEPTTEEKPKKEKRKWHD